MEKWIAGLLIDASPPEKPKFKSPLILIHGLWSGSWCWQRWATHFANLGWECWAVNFRGRVEDNRDQALRRLRVADCLGDLQRIVRELSSPPVLLAHSLGGLIAQKLAEEAKLSALILLSSLPPREIQLTMPRSIRLLRLKYLPLILLRRPFRLGAADLRQSWLAALSESQQSEAAKHMVPDSPHLVREFFDRSISVERDRIACPVLVLAGAEDRVIPLRAQQEMALRLGADIQEYPRRGHWMMGEAGGERIVREIHRWIVRKLGEEILTDAISHITVRAQSA